MSKIEKRVSVLLEGLAKEHMPIEKIHEKVKSYISDGKSLR